MGDSHFSAKVRSRGLTSCVRGRGMDTCTESECGVMGRQSRAPTINVYDESLPPIDTGRGA